MGSATRGRELMHHALSASLRYFWPRADGAGVCAPLVVSSMLHTAPVHQFPSLDSAQAELICSREQGKIAVKSISRPALTLGAPRALRRHGRSEPLGALPVDGLKCSSPRGSTNGRSRPIFSRLAMVRRCGNLSRPFGRPESR